MCDSIFDIANHLHGCRKGSSNLGAALSADDDPTHDLDYTRTVCVPNLFRRPASGAPYKVGDTVKYRDQIAQVRGGCVVVGA